MKTKLLIIMTILISGVTKAQQIGFGCGFAGSPSESVILIDSLVSTFNYNVIRTKLLSDDNSIVCLAVIVCEELDSRGLIELTNDEKNLIKESYNSGKRVGLCGGCIYHGETSMKNILNEVKSDNDGFGVKKDVIRRYLQMFPVQEIGFESGATGLPSKSVILFDSLISTSNYSSIRKQLLSKDNSKKCLAIIVSEILEAKGLILLTIIEKKTIQESYKLKDFIFLRVGNSYSNVTSMNNLLNEVKLDDYGFNFKRIAIKRYTLMLEKTTNR